MNSKLLILKFTDLKIQNFIKSKPTKRKLILYFQSQNEFKLLFQNSQISKVYSKNPKK